MKTYWTEEKRKAAAETARKHRIWAYSTGPKTAEGKAVVSKNALKHGLRGGIFRKADRLLISNNKLLKELP